MKLFARYNRTNLAATIIIFLLASIAFSFLIQYVLLHQVDDNLKIEKREIRSYVGKFGKLPESVQVKHESISFQPADDTVKERLVTIKSEDRNEDEPMRELTFGVHLNDRWYKAIVRTSLQDTDDMIRSIIIITLTTILAVMIATFAINRIVLKKLWQPFYHTISALKDFRIGKRTQLPLQQTDIDEFALLNETLRSATGKAEEDYLILKEFTENASHELQTPLAVIRSKLDLLIQDEQLTEQQSEAVQIAYEHIHKMVRLNQSLLLLAKIENNQFAGQQQLDLKTLTEEKCIQFKEQWQHKQLTVTTTLSATVVTMNPYLADILLNNLFSNAIRHNIPGGKIDIRLNGHELQFCNSGVKHPLDVSRLFVRFAQQAASNEHNGLGLSIVKQICEASKASVSYTFSEGMHCFKVVF
jgi:signal transduction histidine kinase